jgi:hypothetical protein
MFYIDNSQKDIQIANQYLKKENLMSILTREMCETLSFHSQYGKQYEISSKR